MGPEVDVERRNEPCRQVVLGSSNGDSRCHGCDRLVADVLVDQVGGLPERGRLDTRLAAEPFERVDERLAGDPVERESQRIDRRGDQVGTDARGHDRVQEPRAGGPLDEQPDGQARLLADPLHQLLGEVGQQRVGRVVEDHARRSELGDLLRPLDERIQLADPPGAVDEADVELLAGGHDRLTCLAQVRHVVQGVVEPEHVDPVVCCARDESAHDVGGHGT